MQDSNSIVFDSEYIHDQSYIDKKINEIEESVMSMSGVYNSLDNIILKINCLVLMINGQEQSIFLAE